MVLAAVQLEVYVALPDVAATQATGVARGAGPAHRGGAAAPLELAILLVENVAQMEITAHRGTFATGTTVDQSVARILDVRRMFLEGSRSPLKAVLARTPIS